MAHSSNCLCPDCDQSAEQSREARELLRFAYDPTLANGNPYDPIAARAAYEAEAAANPKAWRNWEWLSVLTGRWVTCEEPINKRGFNCWDHRRSPSAPPIPAGSPEPDVVRELIDGIKADRREAAAMPIPAASPDAGPDRLQVGDGDRRNGCPETTPLEDGWLLKSLQDAVLAIRQQKSLRRGPWIIDDEHLDELARKLGSAPAPSPPDKVMVSREAKTAMLRAAARAMADEDWLPGAWDVFEGAAHGVNSERRRRYLALAETAVKAALRAEMEAGR